MNPSSKFDESFLDGGTVRAALVRGRAALLIWNGSALNHVRREALTTRMEVGDLHRRSVAAWRCSWWAALPGRCRGGWEQPRRVAITARRTDVQNVMGLG